MIEYIKNILFNSGIDRSRKREEYGISGLPKDVEDDLRNSSGKSTNCNCGPNLCDNYDFVVQQHHHNLGDFDNVFKEFDKMFKSVIGGTPESLSSILVVDDDSSHEKVNGKRPRDKMLLPDKEKVLPRQKHQNDGDSFDSFFQPFRPIFGIPVRKDCLEPGTNAEDNERGNDFLSITDVLKGTKPRDQLSRDDGEANDEPISIFSPLGFFSDVVKTPGIESAFKYSTISKKVNPDGSTETVKKTKDNNGNEEVSTSRTMGDQTHTIITKRNDKGEEEQVESFINMSEADMKSFEEKWKEKKAKTDDIRNNILKPSIDDISSWWSRL